MARKPKNKIELCVTIHDTPAALRFGGDGYFVTFAGTEVDKSKAAGLMALNKIRLKVTIEVDESNTKTTRKLKGKAPARGSKSGAPKLTDKQRVFVEEYLKCWNATEAARRAGYAGSNETLAVIGFENLRKPNIAKFIQKRISEKAMSADEVLLRLGEIARGSLKPFVKSRDDDIWPDLTTEEAQKSFYLLKKIKPKRRVGGKPGGEWIETEVEIEIHDPVKALELLGRNHKLFTDKHEVSGKDGENIPLAVQFVPYKDDDDTDTDHS